MIRPQVAAAGDVAARELGDQQRGGHRVDRELLAPGLRGDRLEDAAEPVAPRGANVSASHPVALLTRMSTGPSRSSAASNSAAGRGRVGQVGLHRHGPARRPPRSGRRTAAASRARCSR